MNHKKYFYGFSKVIRPLEKQGEKEMKKLIGQLKVESLRCNICLAFIYNLSIEKR